MLRSFNKCSLYSKQAMAFSTNLTFQQKYDFVIFGASGFTGQFTVEEMIRTAQKSEVSWAVAGRNEKKLRETLTKAYQVLNMEQQDIPKIFADLNDSSSLSKMCQNAKIVLNCAGPFQLYGEPVIKACIENKAHHLDISGEPQFLENIQSKYHQLAEDAGVCIIGSCGYDCIPCELALQLMRQNFPGDIAYVESYLTMLYGPRGLNANYGSWLSAVHGFANENELRQLRKKSLPKSLPKSKFRAPKRRFFYSDAVDGWCFTLPAADKSVALRTIYHNYFKYQVRPFQINTYIRAKSFSAACKTISTMFVFAVLASNQFGRKALENYPGVFSLGAINKTGPTRQQLKEGGFVATFVGVGHERKLANVNEQHKMLPDLKICIKVKGPELGYIATPIFMIQAGLVLLQEREKIEGKGGVYTPGMAFANTTLIERLKKNGIDFICETPIKINKSKL